MDPRVTSLRKSKPTARELLSGIKIIDADTHVSEWPELWTERLPRLTGLLLPHTRGSLTVNHAVMACLTWESEIRIVQKPFYINILRTSIHLDPRYCC